MSGWLIRRLGWAALVVFAVSFITYLITFVTPGDPARAIAGNHGGPAAAERIRVALGLDRPPLDQLLGYYGRLLQGDLGRSFKLRAPVSDVILAHLPATIELALAGLAIAVLLGVPLGVAAARRPGGRLDRAAMVLSSTLISVPGFVLGLAMIYLLAVLPAQLWDIRLFPIGTVRFEPFDPRPLALPALTLGLLAMPIYVRVTRTGMLDELGQDHVRTARAKGLTERRVAWHHAFRNMLGPLCAQAGLDLGFFLGGVVVIEAVFDWPGIGRQAAKSITSEDLPLLMGTVLFATVCIVLANVLADLLAALVDPRLQLELSTDD